MRSNLLALAMLCISLTACKSGMISDAELAERDKAACLKEGHKFGSPEYNTCLYDRERTDRTQMRASEREIDHKLDEQRRIREDYRNRGI